MKITKRSQFSEVLVNMYSIDGEVIGVTSGSFCHLASFVKNGFVRGFVSPLFNQTRLIEPWLQLFGQHDGGAAQRR
jgi:hypothetical protein